VGPDEISILSENDVAMKGEPTRRILDLIEELRKEGLL
jgi:hypothetical protein